MYTLAIGLKDATTKAVNAMILARFFRPKWQHRNPQVRRQALVRLSVQDPAAQEVLQRLAVEDTDAEVRKTAIKRIDDLALLRTCLTEDANAGVREVAAARYRQLLAGGGVAADLATRLAELEGSAADEAMLSYVARRGREPELRLAALERVQAAALLEEIAIHDSMPKVRQAAAQRLTEADSLERVMRQSREQDRRVARIAREALEKLRQEQVAAEEARAARIIICDSLAALAAAEQPNEPERQRLQNRWNAIAIAPDPDLLQRFEVAMAACLAQTAEPAPPALAAEREMAPGMDSSGLQALLQSLQENVQPTTERLAQVQSELEQHAGLEEAEPQLALLQAYLDAAERYMQQEESFKTTLSSLQSDKLAEPEISQLLQRLQTLLKAVNWQLELPQPRLLQEAKAVMAQANERLEQAQAQQERQASELEQILAALKSSLDGGHLRESQRLLAQAQRLSEQLPHSEHKRFDRRLRQGIARVRELQDWRRFATLPKQEELCEQMEALIEADLPAPELAQQIRRLQEEWKATGGSSSPEGQQLWERFRAAGDQAFARCRDYFNEQAQLREQNLQQRQVITQQLEQFVTTADWSQLELPGLEAIRSQARAEWQSAIPVNRRAGKAVEDQFEALMTALTEQIRAKQQANRQRKEAIVEQARELIDAEDAWEAAEQAKALQADWQTAGRAQASVDRRLWREFRKICDAIFERRDAMRNQTEQERDERLVVAQGLCEQAEALLDETEVAAAELESRLAVLQADFEALQPLPRAQAGALNQRLRAVERKVADRLRHKQEAREQQALSAARERAELCNALEQAVLTAAVESVEEWQQRWQALAAAPADLQAKLENRWRRAVAAAEGVQVFTDEELAAHLEECWDLCLWMEILAGQDSPAEEQSRRLGVQVQRLADGLAGGGQQPLAAQVRAVEAEWLAAGPMPATEQTQALRTRFVTALAAISEY